MRKDLEEKIMNNIEIKQITKIDNDTLDIITKRKEIRYYGMARKLEYQI